MVVILYGSCLSLVCEKNGVVIVIFVPMTSSLLLCIMVPETYNFPKFHRIKLRFVLKADSGALISKFKSKRG